MGILYSFAHRINNLVLLLNVYSLLSRLFLLCCFGVDHILPKGKYPEKQKDINNFVWVSRIVNRMKHNYTHEEFMNLIEKIYKHQKKMEEGKKTSPPIILLYNLERTVYLGWR